MLLNDKQIKERVGMITPFIDHQVADGKISYGLSSVGYDFRIDKANIKLQKVGQGISDPKVPDNEVWYDADVTGNSFLLPANSVCLAQTVERWVMPEDILGIALGKSTYARKGIILNVTPLEPGWEGILTIELSNTSIRKVRVYVNEGIGQLLFFKIDRPEVTYADRKGKYQGQTGTTLGFVK